MESADTMFADALDSLSAPCTPARRPTPVAKLNTEDSVSARPPLSPSPPLSSGTSLCPRQPWSNPQLQRSFSIFFYIFFQSNNLFLIQIYLLKWRYMFNYSFLYHLRFHSSIILIFLDTKFPMERFYTLTCPTIPIIPASVNCLQWIR